jgi:hypothetical protein
MTMYQGWRSNEKKVKCPCGHTRTYREYYTGYQLSPAFTDGRVCPNCGELHDAAALLDWRARAKG